MAEAVPKIQVTESYVQEFRTQSPSAHPSSADKADGKLARPRSRQERPVSSGKSSAKSWNNSLLIGASVPSTGQDGVSESPLSPQDIDPLSRHILDRTQGQIMSPSKVRLTAEANNGMGLGLNLPLESPGSQKPSSQLSRNDTVNSTSKDKKKGVSFLSRFISNKKKPIPDSGNEGGSETSDPRPEGTDAQLFSQPFDNVGFSPRHPQPPAYIKVRSRFKKEDEFNRVFLAQELKTSAPRDNTRQRPATSAGPGEAGTPTLSAISRNNPIWALEFSKDGKYIAAGGQDKIVRVWAVLSTPEDRRTHEKEEEAGGTGMDGHSLHLSAPVFHRNPLREFEGHTSTILDLSWSKNNFLLSSSMDRTVRLWHTSRPECLCTFKHTDFVPSIQFHPRDDRFFLAGSLDMKLRLWSIPDKSVAFWNQLPDMVTAVSFTPDGKTAIAGTLNGLCLFYETEGLKYQTQMHVKSNHGRNAKGSKITGIQAINFPPSNPNGEVKLLISSNDSRIRLYNLKDKSLEHKFKAHENNQSQIHACFSDDAAYIICGSEDRKAYIWSTKPAEGDKRNHHPVEMFEAHAMMTTCAILAPTKTRQLLSASEDPLYDLCNPPPVTLVSKAESVHSFRVPTEAGSALPTPTPTEANFKRVEESPAYIARSAHPDGNIIITTDYSGSIKVFRQDCAYLKRIKGDAWETSSAISRRVNSSIFSPRPGSITGRISSRPRRDSTSTQPSSDRILSWRQDIASSGSLDNLRGVRRDKTRSVSPRKSASQRSTTSVNQLRNDAYMAPMPDPNRNSGYLGHLRKSSGDTTGSANLKLSKLGVNRSVGAHQDNASWTSLNSMPHNHSRSKGNSQLLPPGTGHSNRGSITSGVSSEDGEMVDARTSIHSRHGSVPNSADSWH